MKDLGRLHHFLGVYVTKHDSGLFLSQRQYMIDILERAGMSDCKLLRLTLVSSSLLKTPRSPMRLTIVVSLVHYSISHSLTRTLLMPFSRFASICMTRGNSQLTRCNINAPSTSRLIYTSSMTRLLSEPSEFFMYPPHLNMRISSPSGFHHRCL
jgi:hypothetical protein